MKRRAAPNLRHRNVAHLWADKRVFRLFRKCPGISNKDRRNLLLIYVALCEIDSDFGEGREIKGFVSTVCAYSGLYRTRVSRYLHILQRVGLVRCTVDEEISRADAKLGTKLLYLYKWSDHRAADTMVLLGQLLAEPDPDQGCQLHPRMQKTADKNPKGSTNHNPQDPSTDLLGPKGTGYSARGDLTPVMVVVSHWNNSAEKSGLPTCAKLTKSRRKKLGARIKQYGLKEVRRAIRAIHQSPFCQGKNDRGWVATIDFLSREDTVAKALEGVYSKRSSGQRIIGRDGRNLILRGGEPKSLDKWNWIADGQEGDTDGVPFGMRIWERDGTHVMMPGREYPETPQGRLKEEAQIVDPRLFGLVRE